MTRWLILLLVPAAALALGAALVPSSLEQAFMFLHDRDYTRAADSFSDRWKNGDRSREVANALAELHVREGDPAKAADILVEYISKSPADTHALARLAEIFRDDQQRNRYIATLERLWDLKKEPGILHSLQKLYEQAGREDDQIRTLETLVKKNAAELNDLITLADLLSPREPKRSLEMLFNAFRRWPNDITVDTAQTMTVLATGEDRPDLVKSVVIPWLARRKSFRDVEPIAVSLTAERLDGLAMEAVKASGAFEAGDPETVVLAARLESRSGQAVQAFDRLRKLRDARRLPARGDDVYIETALLSGRADEALTHVLERGPANLPFWLQSWFVAKLKEAGNVSALQALADRYDGDRTAPALFIRANVLLATGKKPEALVLASQATALVTDVPAAIAVSGLLAETGDTARARTLFRKYAPGPDNVAMDDLAPATTIALVLRDADLALAMATRLREQRPGTVSDILYARALGLAGQTDKALALLDDLDGWSETREMATFEVLRNGHRIKELQRRLLERLDSGETTLQQRTAYVFELNGFKAIEAAVPEDVAGIVQDDLENDKSPGTARLARIEFLGKIDPGMALPYALEAAEADPANAAYIYVQLARKLGRKQDLGAFIASALPNIQEPRLRESLLHEWIAAGVTREALPYIRELADTGDRQWFFAYDEALRKLGASAERANFLTAYARRNDLDPEFRGQLASQILEVAGKKAALDLFVQEAEGAGPRSKEVEQVLFLWGPRPPREGIEWIVQRARTAAQHDRAAWLTRLIEANAADEALPLAAGWRADGDESVTLALATCLEQLRRKAELQALLRTEIARKLSATDAARLAETGESLGLLPEALALYEVAASRDRKWALAAGRVALYAGKPARAAVLLGDARSSATRSTEATCLLAESFYQDRKKSEALRTYPDCLALLAKSGAERPRHKRLEMLALVRLSRFEEAETLVEKSADSDLKADYASLLLDTGNMERVSRFMAQNSQR